MPTPPYLILFDRPFIYRYTQNDRYLTDEQRYFYEENGYIMFRNLVSHESLDEYQQHFLDICNGRVKGGHTTTMKDLSLMQTGAKGEFLINKIQDFLYDDILFKYASDRAVVNIVADIIGENVTAVHSMLINKPPDADKDTSRHPLHQDLHYFPFRPADRICASWTAMETIDERNGCLFAVPGSHKDVLYPHDYAENVKNKAYHGVQGFDNVPRVNLVMEKGDTVFFHPILLHGSGPNLTKGFRKAISVHYANTNCEFIDVRGTSQQNIADEVEQMAKRRGFPVNFEDLWKYKSRLVNGQPGNFQNYSSKL
ncbi:phytanoyl-coa alpha-hydroxylase [Holotrichia oblita]|uniref:Phytanoyl-coa alpha-hydroxylase n=2 Tax=Holotrichia oblita TaxID=644536 RepID=A0ACB9TKH2_HOLOL|nr:phytanoyl-coa alpha-hydroxylase [Holotrichia oblita]